MYYQLMIYLVMSSVDIVIDIPVEAEILNIASLVTISFWREALQCWHMKGVGYSLFVMLILVYTVLCNKLGAKIVD